MATVLGSATRGIQPVPIYPDNPGLKAFMETPDPAGYTEQAGQYGTRAGTIIPHQSAKTSFEQLRKPKHNVRTSIVTIRDATPDNPMGGMQVLVPSFDTASVTSDMMNRAREVAQSMTSDPKEQGVLMYKLLSEELNGTKEAGISEPGVAPQPTPQSVPGQAAPSSGPSPPMPSVLTPEMIAKLLPELLKQMMPQQLPPVQPPAVPVPPLPALPSSPTPVFVGSPQMVGQAIPTTAKLFECLNIPDLDAMPTRPKAQVNFSLGKFGNHMTHYHWIMQEKNALYLVFDTRYDYPMYGPPNLGPDELIDVELINTANGPIKLRCCSCGMSFGFGVFKIFQLLIPENV